MASPAPFKATSRWGSFLAGVESKLDTILADEPTTASTSATVYGGAHEQPGKKDVTAALAPKPSGDNSSRQPSSSKAQDRLTERLAKAVASRNMARKGDGSVTSSGLPSRTASPANVTEAPTSSDSRGGDIKDEEGKSDEPVKMVTSDGSGNFSRDQADSQSLHAPVAALSGSVDDETTPATPSMESYASNSVRASLELSRALSKAPDSPMPNDTTQDTLSKQSEKYEQMIAQMRADHEAAELRRQEEVHDYLERIDALQSKLQYVSKEAADLAKSALSEAKPGSPEQKMAQKDEKIALLIEEGQKLSQNELRHMSMLKKLRVKSGEDETKLADAKHLAEKLEKAARDAQERAKRAEIAERRALEKTKTLSRLEKELDSIRQDREAKATLIYDLQRQLSDATSLAREVERQAQAEALQFEQRLTADLRDEIATLKLEKEQSDKQHRTELRELRDRSDRERERAKLAAIERQGELNILESKLEAFRSRVEEASAGANGDVHAKMLRQIETLQNQYAVASENWQGIEGSLLARVTVLEREKDEIAKREGDVRRKAREMGIKSRRLEEELERAVSKGEEASYELLSQKSLLAALHDKLSKSEADVDAARRDLKAEREASLARHINDEERSRQTVDELSARNPDALYRRFRTESPPVTARRNRKGSTERASPHGGGRRIHGLAITGAGHSPLERPVSRRSSTQPLQHFPSEFKPSHGRESSPFVPQVSVNGGGVPPSPSFAGETTQDEFFEDNDGVHTPATPERTINDMISGSTAGAGPSVQLVERMTAAVRRLESEKASSKEELIRLSAQRDEAREQVVSLMQEAEEKRAADERVRALEKEVKSIEERYLTTLELLGEKSETVEELKADVVDLKELYRELCERTMKG